MSKKTKKRKRESESEDDIRRKIKKYQDKLNKIPAKPATPLLTPAPQTPEICDDAILNAIEDCVEEPSLSSDIRIGENIVEDRESKDEELDEEILTVLGDAPLENKYSPSIHKDLATRWSHILKNGLTKEVRGDLRKKYLPPDNCTTIGAPRLNPEAQAAVTEVVIKRDKALMAKQDQVGCAITALANIFENLPKNKDNLEVINIISDAGRLLCDYQHQESVTRRNFVLQSLAQPIRDAIKETEVDQWLFGEGFSEKLKATKAIKKSGEEMGIKQKKPNTLITKPLNFKGPAANQYRGRNYQPGPQQAPSYRHPVPRKSYPQGRGRTHPMRPPNRN